MLTIKNKIKKYRKYFFPSFLIIIIIILSIVIYNNTNTIDLLNKRINQLESDVKELVSNLQDKNTFIQQQTKTISDLEKNIVEKEQEISGLQADIRQKEQQIESQKIQIKNLKSQVQSLNFQLSQTEAELNHTEEELEETARLLDIAKDYEERVKQGISLSKAYILLGDYDQTVNIVANITGVSTPTTDEELWLRGKAIYDWLGSNYDYCSDKGFCINDYYCTQIQFFSPDELLFYGSQDALCGDCDDKAQLFAGMMYASGVPHTKVRVECGTVSCGSVPNGGGHCWNGIYIDNQWYRIDSVCSNPVGSFLGKIGLDFLLPFTYPSDDFRNVDCFDSYEIYSWYDTGGYRTV